MPDAGASANTPAPSRIATACSEAARPESLVGSFFHADRLGSIRHAQGCVVGEPANGIYLVELFSWVSGGSTEQRLVRIEDMFGWRFYDDAKWMGNAYDHSVSAIWERESAERAASSTGAADDE